MGNFSVFKAAFAGFGLAGRKPVSVLVWYFVLVAYYVGYTALGTYMAGEAYALLSEMQRQMRQDPEAMNMTTYLTLAQETSLHQTLGTILQVLINTVLAAAVFRAMLRPEKPGLAYLRVGTDELKLLLVTIVAFVIIALGTAVPILLAIVGGAVGAIAGSPIVALIIGVIGGVLALCAYFYLSVKFMVAGAQTVAERKILIFESWGISKGRFWKMLATLLLAVLVVAPIAAAAMGGAGWIAVNIGEVSTWREVGDFLSYPPATPAELFTPARIAFYGLIGLFLLVMMLVFLGMPASIFKQVTNYQAQVFSDDDDDEDWDDEDEES